MVAQLMILKYWKFNSHTKILMESVLPSILKKQKIPKFHTLSTPLDLKDYLFSQINIVGSLSTVENLC